MSTSSSRASPSILIAAASCCSAPAKAGAQDDERCRLHLWTTAFAGAQGTFRTAALILRPFVFGKAAQPAIGRGDACARLDRAEHVVPAQLAALDLGDHRLALAQRRAAPEIGRAHV